MIRSADDAIGARPNNRFSLQLSLPEIKEDPFNTKGISVHNGTMCMTEAIGILTFTTLGVLTVLLLCSICIAAFLAIFFCTSSKFHRCRRCNSDRSVVERVFVRPTVRSSHIVQQQPSLLAKSSLSRGIRKDYGRDIVDPAIYSIIIPHTWADRANALADRQARAKRRYSLDENRHLSRPEIENWSLGNADYRRRVT